MVLKIPYLLNMIGNNIEYTLWHNKHKEHIILEEYIGEQQLNSSFFFSHNILNCIQAMQIT